MKPSDYIKRGWCQHYLYKNKAGNQCRQSHADKCCIIGAISLACGHNLYANEVMENLQSALPEGNSLSEWNDKEGRTQKEVADFLERNGY